MRTALAPGSLGKRLKFKHLLLLETLSRTRNMHQAADLMSVTQPAASKILQDVEQIFGFAIFDRLPREMRPTELGEIVIRYAQQTLNATERFLGELADIRHGGYGNLLIGAIVDPAPDILSTAIIRLKERRPLLTIKIVAQTSDQLLTGLEHKTLDLVIGRFTSAHQHNLFDFQALTTEPLHLVVRPGHPLLARAGLALGHLADWPWIMHPLTSPTRQYIEEVFGRLDIRTPANVIETTSVFATMKLLQASDMIAVLAHSVIHEYIEHGLLSLLPVALDRRLEDYGILTRKGDELSGPAREFIDLLRDLSERQRAA